MGTFILASGTDPSVALDLTVDKEGTGGVTGLTPTVAVRLSNSTTQYLDWNDFTFKTTGWATKYQDMSEAERGHYTTLLDLEAVVTAGSFSPGTVLTIEYRVNESGIIGDDHDSLLVFDVSGLSIDQAAQLLDIYRVHGLDSTKPLIVSRTSRAAGAGLVQTVEENVPGAGQVRVTRQ